jgi:beta-lactamase class A
VVRNATIRGRVRVVPSGRAIRRAWRYARRSPGNVSVAVVDSVGRMRELEGRRLFVSASVSKAFMLAAYLRELAKSGEALDPGTAATLEQMITYSDNNASDAIYSSLGDEPIEAAARAAGSDTVDAQGYWSETYLSAEDGARFMHRVRAVVPRRFRRFAMGLLAGITAEQRWGIPEAAQNRWRVWFKGGWRTTDLGALTHQAALLRRGHLGIAIAVLTDGMPSMSSGTETIEGIARRLIPPVSSAGSRP